MAIRLAAESDLEAIVAIYNEAIATGRATADTQPLSIASRSAWFHEHTPDRWPLWVHENDGAVAGWLSLHPFSQRSAYAITAEVSVYVFATHQQRGVGRALLVEAIRRAPALGLRTLVGLVFAHNEVSLRFFGQHGFERWGLLAGVTELAGVERDVVIVGRRVDGRGA